MRKLFYWTSMVSIIALTFTAMSTLADDGPEWHRRGYDLAQTHFYPYGADRPLTFDNYEVLWSYPTASRITLAADVLDGDGIPELISWDSQTLRVFTADGTLFSSVSVPGHTGYVLPVADDVTGDGISEIICWSVGTIWVYDGGCNLLASFSGFGTYTVGAWPVCAMDFDQDSQVEILIRNGNPVVSLEFASGVSDWSTATSTYGGRYQPVGDIDGDGLLEMVPDHRSGGTASTEVISLIDGSKKFSHSYGSAMTSHAIADIVGTSEPEILCFLGRTYYSTTPFRAILYNADGTEVVTWEGPVGRDIADWAIANFDDDPANELLICTYWNASTNSDFRLFLIDDDLSTVLAQNATILNTVWNDVSLCAVDIDGDGTVEILASDKNGSSLRVLNNQLQEIWSYPCPGIKYVSLSDINDDGIPEIVLAGSQLTVLSAYESLQVAALDIKPGSCPNPLNIGKEISEFWIVTDAESGTVNTEDAFDPFAKIAPAKKRGVLPGAILGTDEFDVYDIDVTTVALEGVPVIRHSYEDVSTPMPDDAEECECNEFGPDGYTDLTLKFDKSAITLALGEISVGDIIPLEVTGELLDGTSFTGTDCVVIVGNPDYASTQGDVSPFGLTNYPNPFNPMTEISFSIPVAGHVTLDVFNIMGQKVTTLLDRYMQPGTHELTWNANDVSSGVYFYRLTSGDLTETKKMTLLK